MDQNKLIDKDILKKFMFLTKNASLDEKIQNWNSRD